MVMVRSYSPESANLNGKTFFVRGLNDVSQVGRRGTPMYDLSGVCSNVGLWTTFSHQRRTGNRHPRWHRLGDSATTQDHRVLVMRPNSFLRISPAQLLSWFGGSLSRWMARPSRTACRPRAFSTSSDSMGL